MGLQKTDQILAAEIVLSFVDRLLIGISMDIDVHHTPFGFHLQNFRHDGTKPSEMRCVSFHKHHRENAMLIYYGKSQDFDASTYLINNGRQNVVVRFELGEELEAARWIFAYFKG